MKKSVVFKSQRFVIDRPIFLAYVKSNGYSIFSFICSVL